MNTNFIILTLNCLLIQHNVREGYLIQNHDIIYSTKYTISQIFPDLHQNVTEDGILVSKNKISREDYNNNVTLGKILGYPSAKQYPISRKDKKSGYYTYHVKVKLSKKTVVTLFSFISKDLLYEIEIYQLLIGIQKTLRSDPISKYIKEIYIERILRSQINGLNSKPIEVKHIY